MLTRDLFAVANLVVILCEPRKCCSAGWVGTTLFSCSVVRFCNLRITRPFRPTCYCDVRTRRISSVVGFYWRRFHIDVFRLSATYGDELDVHRLFVKFCHSCFFDITTISDLITSFREKQPKVRYLFGEVERLTKLLLVVLGSSATAPLYLFLCLCFVCFCSSFS